MRISKVGIGFEVCATDAGIVLKMMFSQEIQQWRSRGEVLDIRVPVEPRFEAAAQMRCITHPAEPPAPPASALQRIVRASRVARCNLQLRIPIRIPLPAEPLA